MSQGSRWSTILLLVAVVVVLSFTAYELASWPPGVSSGGPAARDGRSSTTGTTSDGLEQGAVLAVLGDSFSAATPATAGPRWPQILGNRVRWRVYSNAVDGSGYVAAGQGRPFGARVPSVVGKKPDVVIVAGGVGDIGSYPSDQIAAAADRAVTRLVQGAPRARIVVVSPFSNGEPGPLTRDFSGRLRTIAARHHVPYVDATHWLDAGAPLFTPDGTHPDEQAQRQIASRMEQALRRLGLVQAPSGSRAAAG